MVRQVMDKSTTNNNGQGNSKEEGHFHVPLVYMWVLRESVEVWILQQ